MLLLHLSDIHFEAPVCSTPALDPDRPYRTRLLQDARARTSAGALGPVSAILVGGDIAYRGAAEEYVAAFGWLEALAAACGCPLERVFVVPGNHDVDRSVIVDNPSVRNAQQAILRAEPHWRERELLEQFRGGDTGRALLAPLSAYNEFAARFSCQVFPPEHLYWRQDLPLNGGVTLRMHGLTSTLLSGAGAPRKVDDTRESLYLGPFQTVLDPVDDVINLVLCHHPPDWFMDQDEIEDAVRGRAALHLFGHKHRQRIVRDEGYVRFSAGAVNPDRYELGWQPGYNLIKLAVDGEGPARALEVEAHLLAWQTNPDMFRPIQTPQREDVFRHHIRIPSSGGAVPQVSDVHDATAEAEAVTPKEAVEVEAAMSDAHTRNLVFRFWNLAASQRRDIALRLGLIEVSEMQLPEPERYGRALLRAGERGLLDQVAQEVEQMEGR